MAPDLNSVPPSPHPRGPSRALSTGVLQPTATSSTSAQASPSVSRRVSQVMGPPPVPHFPTSPGLASGDNTGVGVGPGPIRHPRPLTVADLHLELEKEQEAVVNRLTRELTLLRQQTASVASTASSTSTNLNDSSDPQHPTASRRNRSSSNISSRSVAGAASGVIAGGVTSIAPSREREAPSSSSRPSLDIPRGSLSREASVTSRHQSGNASPLLSSPNQHQADYSSHHHHMSNQSTAYPPSHRTSMTSHTVPLPPSQLSTTSADRARSGSTSSSVLSRYEEAAYHRAELEAVKRENDILRRRIRELEANLKDYRQTPAPSPPPQQQRTTEDDHTATTTSSLSTELREASIADDRVIRR
ncbi:conserved hypothetical protein [Histoplasma capsulatum G186AR]|uniref:Uncharacterized protein n=2 Tax=Ajellomyces capsulatus TaxID=5037 RepID=C0P020_AJECG|nr:uncharacterized protein HCBG_08750 [Histoplasma capsulatum G186AR]EEH03110.1 conserved hypothetical protein [Histoplasma capsulatum G186AR]KAG5296229.1 hypothetical protein I7I52_06812 [Histoplasma capsulatum]QSS74211.1 hypothetical protein I7I50_09291 [Histoplasma capsulatum G186AR]